MNTPSFETTTANKQEYLEDFQDIYLLKFANDVNFCEYSRKDMKILFYVFKMFIKISDEQNRYEGLETIVLQSSKQNVYNRYSAGMFSIP